jgi:formylmethanofuran dehydrogenase subunit E
MFHRDAVADVKASAWALEYANMRTLDLVRCEECGSVLQSDDSSRLVCDTCLGER